MTFSVDLVSIMMLTITPSSVCKHVVHHVEPHLARNIWITWSTEGSGIYVLNRSQQKLAEGKTTHSRQQDWDWGWDIGYGYTCHRPRTSAKIRISTMPIYNRGCCALARTVRGVLEGQLTDCLSVCPLVLLRIPLLFPSCIFFPPL